MTDTPTAPPVALRKRSSFTAHNRTVTDDYAWLRDPGYPEVKDPEILDYLHAENAWFEGWMVPHQDMVETLFQEMKGRIKEDDASVPVKDGAFLYWREFAIGAQYRTWWRKPVSGGDAQCILDEPVLAEGHEYFRVGAMSVSPCAKFLAYSLDTDGSERFTLFVRDLESGALLPDTIPGTLSALVWSGDSRGLLYGLANDQWRTDNARLHWLGSDPTTDIELYHEADEGFRVDVGMTHSEKFLVIATGDNETSEIRLLPAHDPLAAPVLVAARRKGVEYGVEERDGTLYILTNDTHPNFRLATANVSSPGEWATLIAASDRFYMTGVANFADFFVVEGREDGLDQIAVHRYETPTVGERIAFPEASYDAGLGENPEFRTDTLRLGYESMVTPATTYDYDVASGALTSLKVQEIPSGYDASLYATQRLMLPARDGVMVPVSLVWRRDLVTRPEEGGTPALLYLYAYGAYGYAVPPGFSTTRMSLTDRGFVYAIAHIRGGDDLGRQWWLDGKLTKRTNTFNDFVDVARGLIDAGWAEAGRIAIAGGSAGGELVGAVLNQAPELWGAAAAHVPFVDVLNTMMDATLPLTPGEWPEWGNPIEDAAAFDLLASYSPYDNVTAQAYPPLLVTAGLNDPRVTYWEPAKWVAKLRATKTDTNPLLLKTNMGAGHGGKSGRFESLREDAEEYAFMLGVMGVG